MVTDTAKVVKSGDGFSVEYRGVIVAEESKIANIRAELVRAYKNGLCFIEIENEFTNPEKYKDVAWGEGVPKPKFEKGFLKIRL